MPLTLLCNNNNLYLRLIDKMGMHASDTAEITMENVRVPIDNLIGEEGRGFQYQMNQFQNERM